MKERQKIDLLPLLLSNPRERPFDLPEEIMDILVIM